MGDQEKSSEKKQSNDIVQGTCLCGDVHYEIAGNLGVFQYCHCSRCRKFTGSAHGANLLVAPTDFTWTAGESKVGRFEHGDAKHFATSFCQRCGSSLPWLTQSGKAVVVPAGSLDDHPGIEPMHNIYYASRASWYQNVDDLVCYDELPTKKQ
ncbi:MAG: GFA family protein [Agarilytica sp.]